MLLEEDDGWDKATTATGRGQASRRAIGREVPEDGQRRETAKSRERESEPASVVVGGENGEKRISSCWDFGLARVLMMAFRE